MVQRKKILITGANGQLGQALHELYPSADCVDRAELDISLSEVVDTARDWSQYGYILNAAAYTAVDAAETAEGREAAWRANAVAVANLARIACRHDITLVHVSSEYVFDGTITPHTENEPFTPLGVYAQTKAAGDIAASIAPRHYIARTSWVVGKGNNFIKTMGSLAERGIKPSVVNDQVGRLTFAHTLAAGIKHLIDNHSPYGTYNITNSGDSVSWADIAKLVYIAQGRQASDINPVTTAEYYAGKESVAPRPLQSTVALDKIQSTGFAPADWRDELRNYLETE